VGQEDRSGADLVREPPLASLREGAVTRELPAVDRLANVIQLLAGERRPVEGDGWRLLSARLVLYEVQAELANGGANPPRRRLLPLNGNALQRSFSR
jgi:hypothetical protein